jgi:hypothetical protein
MINNSININKTTITSHLKSDDQQFHQHQQNNNHLSLKEWWSTIPSTSCTIWIFIYVWSLSLWDDIFTWVNVLAAFSMFTLVTIDTPCIYTFWNVFYWYEWYRVFIHISMYTYYFLLHGKCTTYHEKKVQTVMINNSININKTTITSHLKSDDQQFHQHQENNNHLSLKEWWSIWMISGVHPYIYVHILFFTAWEMWRPTYKPWCWWNCWSSLFKWEVIVVLLMLMELLIITV